MALLERTRRLALLSLLALPAACGGGGAPSTLPAHEETGRVTVEVLNASGRAGYARRATRSLREGGLDVLYYGNAGESRDSTLVLIRRGDREAGQQVARLLGVGTVQVGLDSTRRVDVSVLLGRDWIPPSDPRP